MSELQEMVSRKRAVIFDLYHTLTALEITGEGVNGVTISELLGVGYDDWSRQIEAFSQARWLGRLQDGATIVRAMAHAIDPTIAEEKIQEVLKERLRRFGAAMREMPVESLEVIKRLKGGGKRVALLSNADVLEAGLWSECPAANLFDATVFSCHVGMAKPDAAIYRHCLDQLGISAKEAVFVGDGGSEELIGAKAVGLTTVMMTGIIRKFWPERIPLRRPAADFEIEQLAELG